MKRESFGPRQCVAAAILNLLHRIIKYCRAGLQCLQEYGFFASRDLSNAVGFIIEFGVLRRHSQHGGIDQLRHRGITRAQEAHHSNGSAHNAAQDIATPLVTRYHPIADQKGAGASVIRDDAQSDIVLGISAVNRTG
ncbi:unannotated protein [freshwater metagenome]